MRHIKLNPVSAACILVVALTSLSAFSPRALAQKNWKATVGGQSKDMGRQAEAFLPNEFWIHAGDTITWTFSSGDLHTVTFLLVGQPYPANFSAGCPGFSSSGAPFDGTSCVTSMPSLTGQTFEVTFPTPGNFELVCLVHPQMFGTIHVFADSEILPYDQADYDEQAADERQALLDHPKPPTSAAHHSMDRAGTLTASAISITKPVIAGFGNITATPGGQESLSVVRFIDGTVEIHAGDTVEWANWDPIIGHTVTFGTEPADLFDPSCGPAPWLSSLVRYGRSAPRYHHGTRAKRPLGIYLCCPRRLYRWPARAATTPFPSDTLPDHLHGAWNLQLHMFFAR